MSDMTSRIGGMRTSLGMKAPVRCATTGPISLTGLQTIDGETLDADDTNLRVLVKDQPDTAENGIYDAKATGWTRSKDFDGADDAVYGTVVLVTKGSTYATSYFQVTADDPVIIGTSDISFGLITSTSFDTARFQTTSDFSAAVIGDWINYVVVDKVLSSLSLPTPLTYRRGTSTPSGTYGEVLVSGAYWTPIYDRNPTMVSQWGVVGDGLVDDTAAIQAALTGAGEGATVMFESGATYLISARLTTLANQTIDWNGATLKMIDQASTTTTQSVTSATTSFTVTSTAGFTVGMSVVLAKVGVARESLVENTSLSINDVRITNIVGSTITVSTGFSITGTFGSGSTLVNSFVAMVTGTGVKVTGGTFDGNRDNRAWGRWETEAFLVFASTTDGCTAEKNVFQNGAGEGLFCLGDGHRVVNNRFITLSGNGVHFSGAVNPLVHANWFEDCNLDIDIGHQEGAVCWSNGITHATVTDNYITGCFAGIGSFDATDTDATIAGNTITLCNVWGVYVASSAARLVLSNNRIVDNDQDTSLVSGLGYSSTGGIFFNSVSGSDFTITGNQIDETGAYALYIGGSSSPARLTVSDNIILGKILVGVFSRVVIADNVIKGTTQLASLNGLQFKNNDIDLANDVVSLAVSFYAGYARNVDISGNTIDGGAYGISIGDSVTEIKNVAISNNTLRDQGSRGIIVDNTGATVVALVIDGNRVYITVDSVIGIMFKTLATTVARNEVVSASGGSSRTGIYTPTASAPTAVIRDNTTRGPFATDINIPASAGLFCINNVVDGSISDATGNTVSGTVTI